MRKLAIVGSHPDTREHAPFDDAGVEIWVFNEAPKAGWCRRWDACLQLHNAEVYTSLNNFVDRDYWAWLQERHGKPVYMQAVDPRVPDSVRYPLDEILESVPGGDLRWIESSPAYALALALYLGYEEIGIYGMRLTSNTEYTYQLRNFNFWVGVALGAGVRVDLHDVSADFSGRLYAYEGETQIDRADFAARADELERAWQNADKKLHQAKSRMVDALRDRHFEKYPALSLACSTAAIEAGEQAGALEEAKTYAARADAISRQEFERRSAAAQTDGESIREKMLKADGKAEYVWNVLIQTGDYRALEQLRTLLAEYVQYSYDTGARLGIFRENLRYIADYDARVKAAGGQRTLTALGVA